jgi:hypothetical protein
LPISAPLAATIGPLPDDMLTYSLHWTSETKRTCRIKEILEVKKDVEGKKEM